MYISIEITRKKDVVLVLLMEHKDKSGYSYINLTKGHICPCKFKTVAEAFDDLKNYSNIVSWRIIN